MPQAQELNLCAHCPQLRLGKLIKLALLCAWASPSHAWNYFHIGFCNLSSHAMSYTLTFNPDDGFYNNNIFNIPLSGSIAQGSCTPAEGPASWSVSDSTFVLNHYLSFKISNDNYDLCFDLVNPGIGVPYVLYQYAFTHKSTAQTYSSGKLVQDDSTDYTLNLIQFDNPNYAGAVAYAYENPTKMHHPTFFVPLSIYDEHRYRLCP
jgi:hypothetical protein